MAWGRAVAAGGVEPDPEQAAELAENRAILAETRARLDQDLDAWMDRTRAAKESRNRD